MKNHTSFLSDLEVSKHNDTLYRYNISHIFILHFYLNLFYYRKSLQVLLISDPNLRFLSHFIYASKCFIPAIQRLSISKVRAVVCDFKVLRNWAVVEKFAFTTADASATLRRRRERAYECRVISLSSFRSDVPYV